MKKYLSIYFVLLFSFAFLLVGYAAVSRELQITGDVNVKPEIKKIYISEAKYLTSSNVRDVSYDYIYPTNFAPTVNAQARNGSITYEIIIHNNTDVTYWYHGITLIENYESNDLIAETNGISITTKDHSSDTYLSFNTEDWIPPHSYRTFYVTYTYGSNAQGYHSTLVNFHFDVRMDAVHDSFLTILNDKMSENGYNYLKQEFDKRYNEDGTTVIGNIGEDKEVFDNLFGGDLYLEIDGIRTPVTVLIRKENVDNSSTGDAYASGPKGCEYTLYITVDDLSKSGDTANVYAISYTTDSSGNVWYQLAELYEGTAPVVDYDTSDSTFEGSIDISNWIATKKDYEIADGLVYKVNSGSNGDQYDKVKTFEELIRVKDQDIFNDIDNVKIMKKLHDIVVANKSVQSDTMDFVRKIYNSALPYFTNYNNGQEFKVNRSYTRAQLIPVIKDLQEALDYYNQFH